MNKKFICTDKAPKAIGPYSQAVFSKPFLFISGQGAIDAQSQEYCAMGIKDETRLALNNLKAIVEEAGGSMKDIIKTTIFLQDMNDFQECNQVYAEFFPIDPPARSTIQAAALPKGFKVEIEAIALISNP
jgi:2-iminobutanoate/2-iminopropanoate deaminase